MVTISTFWSPPRDLMKFLQAAMRGHYATRCVKSDADLPPSAYINIPTSCTVDSNGWSIKRLTNMH